MQSTEEQRGKPRVLLLLPTSTYRAEAFMEAAERLGVTVTVASEEASTMAELNPAGLLTLDFEHPERAMEQVIEFAAKYPISAVVPVDDQVAAVGAVICDRLKLASNSVDAALASRNKYRMRQLLERAGVPQPRFQLSSFEDDPSALAASLRFPCVVKPLSLAASQGVMRVNNESEFTSAVSRLAAIMQSIPTKQATVADQGPTSNTTYPSLLTRQSFLIEEFISGPEFAVEGLLRHGQLRVLAIFDKPDPLEGPFFEETIYVTPSRQPAHVQASIAETTAHACRALGLAHGPIHAELRLGREAREQRTEVSSRRSFREQTAFDDPHHAVEGPITTHLSPLTTHSSNSVIEVNPRSIGGLCSRVLRFGTGLSLEELIIRHAIDPGFTPPNREGAAAGVMMIPIPRAGVLQQVGGLDAAAAVANIESVVISARCGQKLVPLPEGSLYLGFIFARAESPEAVESALRAALRQLEFSISREE